MLFKTPRVGPSLLQLGRLALIGTAAAGVIAAATAPGSASAATKQPRLMHVGASALTPEPFLEFCSRKPEECGSDRTEVLSSVERGQAQRAALKYGLVLSGSSTNSTESGALRVSNVTTPARTYTKTPPAPVTYADANGIPRSKFWAQLTKVNRAVNRDIIPRTDRDNHGVNDVWNSPENGQRTFGDCEDYVLAKHRQLLEAGIPRELLSIAIVSAPSGELHAVLLVQTQEGEFVLDNVTGAITPWWETAYRWQRRQLPGESFKWVMIAQSDVRPRR